jgi:hypothetical protein
MNDMGVSSIRQQMTRGERETLLRLLKMVAQCEF